MIGKSISHLPREINDNLSKYETMSENDRLFSNLLFITCISRGEQNQQLYIRGYE